MPRTIHNAAHNCNQCDFASSWADALRTHLKTHSGEKSNKCNQCDFACSDTSSLWRHLKTHNGEKPNKCSQCEFPPSQAGNWGYIWKRTVGKNQTSTNLTYLTFLPEKPTCFNSVSQAVRSFCQLWHKLFHVAHNSLQMPSLLIWSTNLLLFCCCIVVLLQLLLLFCGCCCCCFLFWCCCCCCCYCFCFVFVVFVLLFYFCSYLTKRHFL